MAAYDTYMTGIIFCCMAFGIDFPHLDKERTRKKTEAALQVTLPPDYLDTFELGALARPLPRLCRVVPLLQAAHGHKHADTFEAGAPAQPMYRR